MKRMLNTLYVTTPRAYLSQEGDTVCVRNGDEITLRMPMHGLDGIICLGANGCSPALMSACAERGVTISFLSENGRFWARVQGPVSGNVLLRREQYRRSDCPDASADIARSVLIAKIANSRTVLLRTARDYPQSPHVEAIRAAAQRLGVVLNTLDREIPLDTARGYEGEAAQVYFGVFDHLIVAQKESFVFDKRSRRPPLDPVNAMLSFLYAVLAHDTASALEGVGLDPAVGYLHRERPGRPGLALDLMEEFRPILADRLVLSLINRRQVGPDGFLTTESGAVQMDDETRKALLIAYQERKSEQLQHPFLGEKVPLGMVPHYQALLLARYLRGDLDAYPSFIWR